MRRNLSVTGGRQVKNEDFTQYIQSFEVLEQLFSDLNYGDFIVAGCVFSGFPTNLSAGIAYVGGELCLVDSATSVGIPYRVTKTRVGVNPRTFQDTDTKNTAEDLKLIPDPAGVVELNSLPRADERFFRFDNGSLKAPINTDNAFPARDNIWKTLLQDRSDSLRTFDKAPGLDRYLRLGSIQKEDTQVASFSIIGGGLGTGSFSVFDFGKQDVQGGEAIISNQTLFNQSSTNDPELFTRTTSTTIELWIKSPSSNPGAVSFLGGVVAITGEGFSDDDNPFVFENTFNWTATDPGDLAAFDKVSIEDVKSASDQNTANIATNTANIATNTAGIATNAAGIATNSNNIITNAQNIANNTADIGGVKTKKVDIGVWDMLTDVSVIVGTGVLLSKIIGFSCLIQNDSGTSKYPIEYADTSGVVDGSIFAIGVAGECVVSRRAGGAFDSALYSGSGNRGFIIVNYID